MNSPPLNQPFKKILKEFSLQALAIGVAWLILELFWLRIRVSLGLLGVLLALIVLLIGFIHLVRSLNFALRNLTQLRPQALIPLAILSLACGIVIWIDPVLADFHLQFHPQVQGIVPNLEARPLPRDRSITVVDLGIAKVSRIAMARDQQGLTIFFPQYTVGFGDHTVGYTYRSDAAESKIHDPPDGPVHRKIQDHWFWGIDPFDWSLPGPAF
jgi:hypothetical protein